MWTGDLNFELLDFKKIKYRIQEGRFELLACADFRRSRTGGGKSTF